MRVIHLASIDSTNEEAFRRIAAREAAHLDLLLAHEQTAGRGRRGNAWLGTPGQSLFLSVVLMGRDSWSLPTPTVLSMTVGLALVDAAEALGLPRDHLALDWPNDLVATNASPVDRPAGRGADRAGADLRDQPLRTPGEAPKLAGILVEARDFDPEAPVFVVGVGANLLQTSFPPELLAERPVASLAQLGLAVEPEPFARAFARALEALLETAAAAPSTITADYIEATGLAGREVTIELSAGEHHGRLAFLEPDGLRLLDATGTQRSFPLEHVQAIRPR
ncbi:MAG: hypothetical protein P1V81_06905 [Planctomycetota bacterium]|nr:hypothetical protein [Planctomycetota bacterium]